MSLTREQKKDLNELGEYFRKIEKLAVANKIDLDVFMTVYREDGYHVYSTETIGAADRAEKRKRIFEKAGKEKTKTAASRRS